MSGPCADLIHGYIDHLRILGRAWRTITHYRWVLSKADTTMPCGLAATKEEIAAWLYRDDLSRAAKATYFAALAGFYAYWACRPGGLAINPMIDLPRPKQPPGAPRPVTGEQLRRILTDAAEPYRLWALIAAGLGARCVEIARLDRDDVTQESTWLQGKGDKPRTVPTHPAVWTVVSALPAGPVARTVAAEPADAHYISAMAGRYFRHDLGMPGVTMHRLRHWYATMAHRTAKDIRVTQELLGHTAASTTARYTEVDFADKLAAVVALDLPVTPVGGGPSATAGQAA